MRSPSFVTLTLVTGAGLAALLFSPRQIVQSQSPAPLGGGDVAAFRIEFGVTDTAPRAWNGSVKVSSGELLGVRDWHPVPENQVSAQGSWKLSSEDGVLFVWRPWEAVPSAPARPYIRTHGVVVDVKGANARLEVATPQGSFQFRAADVVWGKPAAMLGGAVRVDRVPTAELLSTPAEQDDFVSMLGGADGEVWVAWLGYRDKANQVFARRFDGSRWTETQTLTERPGDHHMPKLGRDAKRRPWAVWSAQVDGNWDLYGRYLEGSSWSAVERLTTSPQPDIFPNLATDSKGGLWLVWQGFRNGRSDIFARRHDGAAWGAETQISTSRANDWEPVIAADSKGRVHVAWDTYDKGSYDVMLRTFDGSGWGEPAAIADTPLYEAHVTLAVDGQDRLWAAWNESGTNWGKDTGWILNREATRLYQWRNLNAAVLEGGAWKVPSPGIQEALPESLREYNDFPVLHADSAGRVWLYFRNRTSRIAGIDSNAPNHRAVWEIWGTTLEGGQWLPPVHFPFTRGRQDVRWALANDGRGNTFAAWPTDNRDYREFLFQHSDVYAARLPNLPGRPQPPALQARTVPEIPFFEKNPKEREDLNRIQAYEIRSGGRTYKIYRGDTHRHTEFSMDGNNDGSLLQTYRYAMDAAELEFLLASEHNGNAGPDLEYINWLLQQTVDLLTVPGKFRAFYGYERSLPYPNGHRNVLFARRGNPTLPIPVAEQRAQTGAQALYEYLKKYNGIAISHTSATGMGTDWRDNDPDVEPLVEIYQGDRVSAEYLGAPRSAHAKSLTSAPGNFRPAGYVWNAWAKGYKLGVQAASDHLSTHISYACTLAEEFTLDGLLDAMKKRHSYGATDNIILDYRLHTGGKEYLQGDIVDVSGDFRLSVKIIGTSPIRQIDIIRNQEFVHNRQNLDQEVSFTFTDTNPRPGESFYYVRVIQHDDQIAWSSPIWINRR